MEKITKDDLPTGREKVLQAKSEELFFEAETRKHQQEVSKIMLAVARELIRRATVHDASKLEDPERETFIRVTPLLRMLTYGSPEYKVALKEMGPALEHHYRNNDHHPEFYDRNDPEVRVADRSGVDLSDGFAFGEMGLLQLVEMLCDWMAATKRHADGDIDASLKHNASRFGIDKQMAGILKRTVSDIEDLLR
jgi:hypothetical protein